MSTNSSLNSNKGKFTLKDFEIIGLLAEGSFASVYEAIYNSEKVVLKRVHKDSIAQAKKQNEVFMERHVLMKHGGHQGMDSFKQKLGMINFHGCFQDQLFLYFILEYCPYGDLSNLINQRLCERTIRCYVYQIVLALKYLHDNGIAHLDLKPHNFVIDKNQNLKLIDFATCCFYKQITKQLKDSTSSPMGGSHKFVGSPEYVSPEMLEDTQGDNLSDLWSLGCIVYYLYHGYSPFVDETEIGIFHKISDLDYKIKYNIPEDAKQLIQSLLLLDPNKRNNNLQTDKYFNQIEGYKPWIHKIVVKDLKAIHAKLSTYDCTPKSFQSMPMIKLLKLNLNDYEQSPGDVTKNSSGVTRAILVHRMVDISQSCLPQIATLTVVTQPNQLILRSLQGKLIRIINADKALITKRVIYTQYFRIRDVELTYVNYESLLN